MLASKVRFTGGRNGTKKGLVYGELQEGTGQGGSVIRSSIRRNCAFFRQTEIPA